MKKLKTSIINIEYTKDYEKEALKLRRVFDANPLFFEVLLSPIKTIRFVDEIDLECDDALEVNCIEDIKQYLKDIIKEFVNKLKITQSKNIDMTETLFLKYILLDKLEAIGNYNPEFKDRDDTEQYINSIYSLVASYYYDDPIDLVDSLFKMDEVEKDTLYRWLRERRRYDLLNHLLEEQYDLIITGTNKEKTHDPFIKEYINEIIAVTKIDSLKELISTEEESNQVSLPKLSKEELDKLVKEFLITIDPSLKWLKIYNDLVENNLIKYKEEVQDDSVIWSCSKVDDKWHIIAPLSNTIKDFRCMIHEFSHYISLINDPKELQTPTLKEYPPILFESLAIDFLRKKGYPKEITDELLKERKRWTQNNVHDISPTLLYLKDYINDGPITFEKEKKKQADLIRTLQENIPEDLESKLDTIKEMDDEKIKADCDLEISFILSFPTTLYDEYPYVMGNYLAIKTLERLNEEPTLLYTVLDITENLKDKTPEEIMHYLGLSTEEFTSKKTYQYQKKQENK